MMTSEEILKELKSGVYRPIYLLMGEEPYHIDVIANYIEANALNEADKAFNQTIFYGKDTNITTVIHEADQYPAMAQRRLVIVREAQDIDKIAALESYVANIQESTILVICYKNKSIDKRLKWLKAIDKVGAVMETKRLYDNQVPAWITNYLRSKGLAMEEKAVALMAESIGTNISAIVSAIEKLQVAIGGNSQIITTAMVADNIGVSKEYNVFELREALFARNVSKVNKIVAAFGRNPKQHPIQPVVALLFGAYQKLFSYHYLPDKSPYVAGPAIGENPYNITRLYEIGARNYSARKCLEIISLLREYDMRSKGFASPQIADGDLILELTYRIMN